MDEDAFEKTLLVRSIIYLFSETCFIKINIKSQFSFHHNE